MTAHFDSPLWVVTSYFNPSKYKRRLENFHTFRRFLNAPLLVVELERDGEFQLTQDDGEIVIQLTGEDRIWQKERLINIGIENLPDHVEYVAWVDCDVIFEDEDWSALVVEEFKRGARLIQLFQTAAHLSAFDPEGQHERPVTETTTSILDQISFCHWSRHETGEVLSKQDLQTQSGKHHLSDPLDVLPFAPGFAWAARREIADDVFLYDANIVGGGDRAFAYAVAGYVREFESSERTVHDDIRELPWRTKAHVAHFVEWAREVEDRVGRKITYLPQKIFHLWHGDLAERGYSQRHKILTDHHFDPMRDLLASKSGPWRWAQPESQLAKAVGAYLDMRREDG